jgi:hypothetical protein
VERETRNSLRCWSGCPSVDSGCLSTVVAVAAGVSAAAAVAVLPLSDVFWWVLTRSQVG